MTSVLGARARCWGRPITGDDEDTHGRRNERRVSAGSESRRVWRGGQWLAGANDRCNGGVGLGWSRTTGEWTRGRGGRRLGDVGAGSGVAAAGGRATSVRTPGSRRLEVGRRRRGLRGRGSRRSGDISVGSRVVVAGGCWRSAALPVGGRRPGTSVAGGS
jgi:hypothetical protein